MIGDTHNVTVVSGTTNWQQLHDFAQTLKYGNLTITIKDGVPVRIDQAIQTFVFKI